MGSQNWRFRDRRTLEKQSQTLLYRRVQWFLGLKSVTLFRWSICSSSWLYPPPKKNECHLKRDPFQLGKRIIIFKKKNAVFSGSLAGLKSDPPGLQDCIIFCLEDSYNLYLPRFLGGKNSPKHQVSLLRRCAGQLKGRQATTRTSRDRRLRQVIYWETSYNIGAQKYISKKSPFLKKNNSKFRCFFFEIMFVYIIISDSVSLENFIH